MGAVVAVVSRLSSVAVLMGVACGCAGALGGVQWVDEYDEFEQKHFLSLRKIGLGGSGLTVPTLMLEPTRVTNRDGLEFYFLTATYTGRDWLFIESGESLVFLVDGERVGLTLPGNDVSRETSDMGAYGVYCSETAVYSVSLDLLRKLAGAQAVKVRLSGKYDMDRFFTQGNFQAYQLFVKRVSGKS